jgi:hypothetical protein
MGYQEIQRKNQVEKATIYFIFFKIMKNRQVPERMIPGENLVLGKIQRDLKSGIKKGPFYKKFL